MLVLKPSPIAGIGVFTTARIRKGVTPPLFVHGERIIRKAVKGYQGHYAIYDAAYDGYLSPRNFHRMSIGWYLNHSDKPNCTTSLHPRTLRFIEAGEELTIDYNLL